MKVRSWMCALVVTGLSATASMAQVTGTAKLDGKAPEAKQVDMSGTKECNDQHPDPVMDESVIVSEGGELKNVVVSVKKEEGMELTGEAPKGPAVLDQHGCMYTPRVLAMMVGQDLVAKNSDPFLHNVQANPSQNPPFNDPQPNIDPGKKVSTPKVPEQFAVKCQVHPWMVAEIVVFDHPFFAVSDDKGAFSIAGVPDGEYTFQAWHEKFGTQEAKGTVKDGKATIDFTFKAEAAAGETAPQMKTVQLASQPETCEHCETPAASPVVAK